MDFALALQGIGGMNSFSAGVLSHLRKENIKPQMISVSSGAIHGLYHYLDENENKLEEVYINKNKNYKKQIISKEMQGLIQSHRAVSIGVPGIFRVIPFWERLRNLDIKDLFDPFSLINTLAPAKSFEPLFKSEFCERVAERFSKSKISIITNAYNYDTGKSVIFLNEAAKNALKGTRFEIGNNEFSVQMITPDAIQGALQILQYGTYKGMLDGAYQFNPFIEPLKILKNLVLVTVVPITKPLKPLENKYDVEDFKLKMLFLNSTFSEISHINLVNKWIDTKIIPDDKIHKIDLEIIEPGVHKGLFDYFVEDSDMFKDGFQKAKMSFRQSKKG